MEEGRRVIWGSRWSRFGRLALAGAAPAWLTAHRARVAGIALVALVLRSVMLGGPPLWRDEAFSAVVARLDWPGMFNVVAHDSSPPLSYILIKLATYAWPSPAGLRLGAALAGVAAVPLAAALGRRLGGERASLGAAGAVATMPSLVLVSRDLRMYALAFTLLLAAGLALWRALEDPSPGRLAGWAALVAACLYTHYLTSLGIAGEALAAAIFLRPGLRPLILAAAAAAAACLTLVPWLAYATPQLSHATAPFWAGTFSPIALGGVVIHYAGGSAIAPTEPAYLARTLLRAVAITAAFAGLCGAVAWATRQDPPARRGMAYLAGCTACTLLLLSLASEVRPVFDARYALPYAGPFLVALGAGLARFPRALGLGVPAVLAAAALPLALLVANPDVPRAVAYLDSHAAPQDEVITTGAGLYFPLEYYAGPALGPRIRIVAKYGLRWFDGTADIPPGTTFSTIPDSQGRIFVVGGRGFTDRLPPGFRRTALWCAYQVCVHTYAR